MKKFRHAEADQEHHGIKSRRNQQDWPGAGQNFFVYTIDDIDKEMQKVEKYWKGDASKLFLLNYAKTDISLGSMMDILTESKNEMQEICKKYNNCEQSVGDMIKGMNMEGWKNE